MGCRPDGYDPLIFVIKPTNISSHPHRFHFPFTLTRSTLTHFISPLAFAAAMPHVATAATRVATAAGDGKFLMFFIFS
jgi:hypothetical protein